MTICKEISNSYCRMIRKKQTQKEDKLCTFMWDDVVMGKSLMPDGTIKDCKKENMSNYKWDTPIEMTQSAIENAQDDLSNREDTLSIRKVIFGKLRNLSKNILCLVYWIYHQSLLDFQTTVISNSIACMLARLPSNPEHQHLEVFLENLHFLHFLEPNLPRNL